MAVLLCAGNKEGVYGWVAANYASGALQVESLAYFPKHVCEQA